MADRYDVVVIGAGPGGYEAAIRAAQLGLSTACIDDWTRADGKPAPGGTCTNVGCIPSKALLQSSENYEEVGHAFAEHGISVSGLAMDVAKMLARKEKVVAQNNDGILYLFKKNKVAFFHGKGAFAGKDGDAWKIAVTGAKPPSITGTHVIVATGSKPRALPGVAIDNVRVLDNEGALAIPKVPKKLGVVGAGVIGLEMGSVWRRLGAEVTMLEALPSLLPVVDVSIAKEAQKLFTRQGLAIHTGVRITDVKVGANDVTVTYDDGAGKPVTATYDHLIVSIGRVPFTGGLDAQSVGLAVDERGFVKVDDDCRTNLPNVWAIGDVVRGPMLAHKAEEEGVSVAERIAGQKPHVDFNTIPWVIYTSPEIAWVGQDRAAGEGRRHRLSRRQLPVHGQRPRPRDGRYARPREDGRRPQDRPDPRRAHDRSHGVGADQRGRHRPWSSAPRAKTSRASATRIPRCPKPSRRPPWRWTAGR